MALIGSEPVANLLGRRKGASIAQSVEQRILNPWVLGSSPSGGTNAAGTDASAFVPVSLLRSAGSGGALSSEARAQCLWLSNR